MLLAKLPGISHGQENLLGYSPWGHRVGHDWATNTFIFMEKSKVESLPYSSKKMGLRLKS